LQSIIVAFPTGTLKVHHWQLSELKINNYGNYYVVPLPRLTISQVLDADLWLSLKEGTYVLRPLGVLFPSEEKTNRHNKYFWKIVVCDDEIPNKRIIKVFERQLHTVLLKFNDKPFEVRIIDKDNHRWEKWYRFYKPKIASFFELAQKKGLDPTTIYSKGF